MGATLSHCAVRDSVIIRRLFIVLGRDYRPSRRNIGDEVIAIEASETKLGSDGRRQLREQRSKPIAESLRQWLIRQRGQVPDGSATAKAINYSLGRWAALVRYLDDGDLPIDNNHVENRIRPVALGRSNWLFAGSLRAGQRAAAIMSLIQSAKLNGHDPYRYLKDILERLPTRPASRVEELLPHRWRGVVASHNR
jgi:transposase